MKLTNRKGALRAAADFYTWGLQDKKDVVGTQAASTCGRRGAVLRKDGDDQLLVFAVNNWTRWSNAAAHEFDVVIDVDRDGEPDFIVFSYDAGAIRAGDPNGLTEVFVYDIHKADALSATGFLAQAPTDSSTILLPVYASDLGIRRVGRVRLHGGELLVAERGTPRSTSSPGVATYDPWKPAITNGEWSPRCRSTARGRCSSPSIRWHWSRARSRWARWSSCSTTSPGRTRRCCCATF